MNTVKTVRELRAAVARARSEGKRIGFVPTMGNLHAGHAALVKAGERADFVVVSIFVNPLQFGPSEDLDKYPRTLAADQERLLEAGCHLLFTPTVEEMYPDGMDGQTRIHVPGVSEGLCGASRPGHFEGVATVVSKLLNMVQPDLALFGEKDFQQLAVIRKLVRDLNLPVQIFGEPTVRAADGLALSSRNGYLDEQQRAPPRRSTAPFGSSANASAPAPRTSRHCSPTPARPWNRPGCAPTTWKSASRSACARGTRRPPTGDPGRRLPGQYPADRQPLSPPRLTHAEPRFPGLERSPRTRHTLPPPRTR